jgi:hypothetical protein
VNSTYGVDWIGEKPLWAFFISLVKSFAKYDARAAAPMSAGQFAFWIFEGPATVPPLRRANSQCSVEKMFALRAG